MRNVSVLIGRFQPLHEGHKELITRAARDTDQLIMLLGSADQARSLKNPWKYVEREQRIRTWFEDQEFGCSYRILPINDHKYSDTAWCAEVEAAVRSQIYGDAEIKLVGHMKRGNSYLKYFPQWKYEEIHTGIDINATLVRDELYRQGSPVVPKSVLDDYAYFQKEAKTFSVYPYPETLSFTCADTILECAGHILLIRRKYAPGAGNWALAGGFKNRGETRLDCAIRELIEETNVRVPEKVLRGNIRNMKLYDAPDRGSGIPRETFAVHIVIEPEPDGSLPRANGADDAVETRWVSIYDIMNSYVLHDDHKDIIKDMTGAIPLPAFLNHRITGGLI